MNNYYSIMGSESFNSHKEELSNLFGGSGIYKVPPNQRDYEWDNDLLEYFWDDLLNSYEQKDKSYYFGSVIFQKNIDDRETTVYDGQQRLATLSILWAVIRDKLAEYNYSNTADIIHKRYITRVTETGVQTPILTLNSRNKDVFQECIQKYPNPKKFDEYEKINNKLDSSNDKIRKCYLFFESEIKKKFEELNKSDKDKLDFLKMLSSHLSEHFILVIIGVSDEEEAYMVYEAINQKRLELSVADLFKNYLIRKTTDQNKEQTIEIWDSITKSLDDKIRPFLKHYWHSKKGIVTERRLFKELKIFVEKDGNDVFALAKELGEESKIYSALTDPDSDYWGDELKELIRAFNILEIEQPLPVLMIAKKRFDDKEFKLLLEAIINFSFRYNIICNLQSNVLEKRFSTIAKRIRGENVKIDEKINNTKGVLKMLEEFYPDDKKVEENFLGKTIKKKIALYLWIKINAHLTKYEKPNPADLNLEHILPIHPDKEWKTYLKEKGIDAEQTKRLIERIGNQTAIDRNMNTQAKNKFFIKKRDENYKYSKMSINASLRSITDWTEKEINQREKDYIKSVNEIWKIDFS